MRPLLLLLLPGLFTAAVPDRKQPSFPAQVLIIRHAEKPSEDDLSVDLSPAGKKRAEALPGLFIKSNSRPAPFPRPDFIFATKNSMQSHRPLETVTPLAKKLGITVNFSYRNRGI